MLDKEHEKLHVNLNTKASYCQIFAAFRLGQETLQRPLEVIGKLVGNHAQSPVRNVDSLALYGRKIPNRTFTSQIYTKANNERNAQRVCLYEF